MNATKRKLIYRTLNKSQFISKRKWNDKTNKTFQKTNRNSGYIIWSIKSGFGIVDLMMSRWIKNIHGLFATCDNVFEFSLNTSSVGTFKNDNIESHVIENIDAIIEKRFLIDWMKTFQNFRCEWSTKSKHRQILERIRNHVERLEILSVNGSGFWRFVIVRNNRLIYWRSRADYTQSISSFFKSYLKTEKRTILIEANVIDELQPVKKLGLSRFLQATKSRNDWATQKIYSDISQRQSILSKMIYWKIITYAGLTNETKIVFRKLGIWRRHKQGLFIPWLAINIHKSMNDRRKIYYHGRCRIMKRHNSRFGLGRAKSYWTNYWRKKHTGKRQTYYATKTNWIQCEIKKHGLWLNMTLTGVVRFGLRNFPMMIKANSYKRRNGSRKRMIE